MHRFALAFVLAAAPLAGCGDGRGGPDRDCRNFDSRAHAERFYVENGGPERDPHGLDRDRDGLPCEHLR